MHNSQTMEVGIFNLEMILLSNLSGAVHFQESCEHI